MNEAARRVQQAFERVARERMADFPLCNPALRVRALGFGPWEQHLLGVLVTPWAMNLMLLPGEVPWADLPPGSKQRHRFPSGDYDFVVGFEPGIGPYQSCSLFSPLFEFADQESAEAAAAAALSALLDQANRERFERPGAESKDITKNAPPLAQRPMTRRGLLRGALFKDGV